ncbi:hypothetical protein ACKVV1_004082 [Pyricularia oryzae]
MHTFKLFTTAIAVALAVMPNTTIVSPGRIRDKIQRYRKFIKGSNGYVHDRLRPPPEPIPVGTGVKAWSQWTADDCYVRILHGSDTKSVHKFAITPNKPATFEGLVVGGRQYPLSLTIKGGCMDPTLAGTIPPDYGVITSNHWFDENTAFVQGFEPIWVENMVIFKWTPSWVTHTARGGMAAPAPARGPGSSYPGA